MRFKALLFTAFLSVGSAKGSVFCIRETGAHRVLHCYTATEELVAYQTPSGRFTCSQSWALNQDGFRTQLDSDDCPHQSR
jgi:hypothetical protein